MRRQRPNETESARDGSSDVTNVLLYSKKLLAALTQWSRHEATEVDVSDAFVSFGNEFNSICRLYMSMGIETNDLGDVPQMLREVLEVILAEEASTQNLDHYYPRVTNIILPLIKQLKHKAAIARLNLRSSGSFGVLEDSAESQTSSKQNAVRTSGSPQRNNATVNHSRVRPKVKSPPPQIDKPLPVPGPVQMEISEPVNVTAGQRRVTEPQHSSTLEQTVAAASEVIRYASDPAVKDSLARLQQSDGPARRASRRFSAYHMSKVTTPDSMILPTTTSHTAVTAEYYANTVLDESWRVDRSQASPATTHHTLNGRLTTVPEQTYNRGESPDLARQPSRRSQAEATPEMRHTPTMQSQVCIRIFLRMGNRILKAEVQSPPSLAAIRLQFVDSFAYVPPSGQLFPELAVQDPSTGIEYELNEQSLRDVSDGTLVVLKAKSEEEINLEKRMLSIEQMVKELLTKQAPLQQTPAKPWQKPVSGQSASAGSAVQASNTVQAARTEIASIRQAASKGFAAAQKEIAELSGQILALRESGLASGGARRFMDEHIRKLETNSEELVTLIDDLQDLVDGQRKDVASRGVRMSNKELEATRKDLDSAQAQLDEFANYISREKPAWKHTWGEELEKIVTEQEQLRLQEKLINDMAEDLRSAHETFLLVEECSLELAKSESVKRPSIAAPDAGDVSGSQAREALLGEVQALRPNHEQRIEAIERAERVRKRELAMRTEEFEQELDGFVTENKLRPSGGIEALERKREQIERDTRAAALKSEAEAQQRRREENERKREAHKKRLQAK